MKAVPDIGGSADLVHDNGTITGGSSCARVPAVVRGRTLDGLYASSSPSQGGVLVENAAKSSAVRRVQIYLNAFTNARLFVNTNPNYERYPSIPRVLVFTIDKFFKLRRRVYRLLPAEGVHYR